MISYLIRKTKSNVQFKHMNKAERFLRGPITTDENIEIIVLAYFNVKPNSTYIN